MKKCFAFDFDGTLADTLDPFYEAFGQACIQAEIGALTQESFLQIFEGNMFEGLSDLGMKPGGEAGFMDHLKQLLTQSQESVRLFSGIREMLNELGEKAPVYVITSNASAIAQAVLDANSVTTVRAVLGGDVERSKVVKLTNLKETYPDRRLYYVGDTCGDITEAHHAGAKAVAVSWGWHSVERLQKVVPDHVLQSPADIFGV